MSGKALTLKELNEALAPLIELIRCSREENLANSTQVSEMHQMVTAISLKLDTVDQTIKSNALDTARPAPKKLTGRKGAGTKKATEKKTADKKPVKRGTKKAEPDADEPDAGAEDEVDAADAAEDVDDADEPDAAEEDAESTASAKTAGVKKGAKAEKVEKTEKVEKASAAKPTKPAVKKTVAKPPVKTPAKKAAPAKKAPAGKKAAKPAEEAKPKTFNKMNFFRKEFEADEKQFNKVLTPKVRAKVEGDAANAEKLKDLEGDALTKVRTNIYYHYLKDNHMDVLEGLRSKFDAEVAAEAEAADAGDDAEAADE